MAGNRIMLPWMPPFVLWGSPLYNELCVGLCRALAGPWLGVRLASNPYPTATGHAVEKTGRSLAPVQGWRLLDSQSDGDPHGASSLAELGRTVRGTRDQNGISSSRSS